jgi:histidinol-phosphate aminotransferase
MSILSRARADLLHLAGYSSARMEAGARRVMLNANESPWPADDALALNRYPDPQPAALRKALASYYGVATTQILAGRGSDEAIDLLTRAFCRAGLDEVIIAPPTFGMYAVCAGVQGARVVEVPRLAADDFAFPFAAVAAAVTENTRLVYVCTPNNPTGDVASRAEIVALAVALRDRALVVVDEAYQEFAADVGLAADVAEHPNLAVLRTMSKAHALAGARIGVLIAAPDVIELCRRIMAPYPLPMPCVTAALAALEPDALSRTRERVALLVAERARVSAALLDSRAALGVLPSRANFITARFADANAAYATLLSRGIVVRDVSRQPGLAQCLRLSIGTPDENDALLAALRVDEAAA